MTTSRTSFLSEILSGDPIPLGKLAYFQERFKNRLYDAVVSEFLRQERESGLTRAEIARRIGKKPEQLTRWLGAPGNWTLATVSDLLLAMGCEPEISISRLDDQPPRNFIKPGWLGAHTAQTADIVIQPAGGDDATSVDDDAGSCGDAVVTDWGAR